MNISRLGNRAFTASAISLAMRAGIANLRFEQPLEGEFQEKYLEQNLLRARVSTTIYLTLLGVLSVINVLGGLVPAREVLDSIFAIRGSALCPALATILAATYVRPLKARYQTVVGLSVTVAGIAVMSITAMAATASLPQFAQMGNVLVVVYGCLFLGLMFNVVVMVATVLVTAFFSVASLYRYSYR